MTIQNSSPPPGWYPNGHGHVQWWDGTQWTQHFAPAPQPVKVEQPKPAVVETQPTTHNRMDLIQLRRGTGAISTVGEQYNERALRKVWRHATDHNNIMIALVPEPSNRHDPNAIRMDVLIKGASYTAGHMGREEASVYAPYLHQLAHTRRIGYGYGKIREGYDHFQVYVRLSTDPARLVPPTITDPIGVFVDGLFPLTVVGEELHQDRLEPYAAAERDYVFALHTSTIEKGKHAGERTYSVYLDGHLVGALTKAMADKHSGTFDRILNTGHRPYLAGRVETDHRGHQVILEGPLRE